MALTKDKKTEIVKELETLLANSKLTVTARYQGTPVKAMQKLRSAAANDGTTVKVVKNRLFKLALDSNSTLKAVDSSDFTGQLIYAFNADDEVSPAKAIAEFAKFNPQVEFVAGITSDGQLLDSEALKSLASLPTKDVLRAQLVGTIAAPVSGFLGVLTANVRSILNVLNARAEALGE